MTDQPNFSGLVEELPGEMRIKLWTRLNVRNSLTCSVQLIYSCCRKFPPPLCLAEASNQSSTRAPLALCLQGCGPALFTPVSE